MAGILFVVCVPTCEHEAKLREQSQSKSVSSINDGNKSQSSIDLIKSQSTTMESLCESNETDNTHSVSTDSNLGKEISVSSLNSSENSDRNNRLSVLNTSSDTQLNKSHSNNHDSNNGMKKQKSRSENELKSAMKKRKTADWTKMSQLDGNVPMEKLLETLLKKLNVDNAVWCAGENDEYYQVFFSVATGIHCEDVLRHLGETGIGVKFNSVVSVIPCSLYYQAKQEQPVVPEVPKVEKVEENKQKQTGWDKFVASVRARLIVAQVVEGVKADATLTFDFIALLIIAGCVAAMGLLENSSVVLVASMLISPLMGPILAGTFGTVIGDRHLQKIGVVNELIGLFLCLVVGFVFGIVAGLVYDHWGTDGWPTNEMISRGQMRSLWVGVLIALPSGAGVAIGVLEGNTASLVGVAISASLLPPAVNAGLFWALSFVNELWKGHMKVAGMDFTNPKNETYIPAYSDNASIELAILGVVSLCLTLVNIICIFIAGILVFKIKEVSPSRDEDEMQFWKHDIKIARDYNRTFNGEDAVSLHKRLEEDLARTNIQPNLGEIGSPVILPETFNKKRRLSVQELERIYTKISTPREEVVIQAPLVQQARRRHSSAMIWRPGPEITNAAGARLASLFENAEKSGNALSTITESNLHKLTEETGSDLHSIYTVPSVQPQYTAPNPTSKF